MRTGRSGAWCRTLPALPQGPGPLSWTVGPHPREGDSAQARRGGVWEGTWWLWPVTALMRFSLERRGCPKTAHTGIKSRVLQQAGSPQQVGTLLGRQALWLLNPLTVVLGRGGCPGLHPHCGSLGSGIRGPVHVRAVLGTSLAASSVVLRRLPLWGDAVHTCLAAMSL